MDDRVNVGARKNRCLVLILLRFPKTGYVAYLVDDDAKLELAHPRQDQVASFLIGIRKSQTRAARRAIVADGSQLLYMAQEPLSVDL